MKRAFLMGLVVVSVALAAVACGGAQTQAEGDVVSDRDAQEVSLGVYTSPEDGFSTNAYWLETRDGVILFDAQFLPEHAAQLLTQIEAKSGGKAISDVIISHGNPDKYNGLEVILAKHPEAKVWATPEIVARINEVDPGKRGYFGPLYGERYAKTLVLPDTLVTSRQRLDRGGVTLELIPMGAGVSSAHLVTLINGEALVVGDLLHEQTHGWLAEGFSDQWLARLDELSALGAARFYPGRGHVGDASLISAQREYLLGFQRCVGAQVAQEDDAAAQDLIKRCVIEAFPTYSIEAMIDFSVPGERARQRELAR